MVEERQLLLKSWLENVFVLIQADNRCSDFEQENNMKWFDC